jgi:hypothetical protein
MKALGSSIASVTLAAVKLKLVLRAIGLNGLSEPAFAGMSFDQILSRANFL